MSIVKEGEAPAAPGASGIAPGASGGPKDGGASTGTLAGAPRGSAALTGEDLSTAYNLGLRNNNELTQQLLLDQVILGIKDMG